MRSPAIFLRSLYDHSPASLQKLLKTQRSSMWFRWLLWKFLGYPNPKQFINERELQPCYREALRYLQEKVGAENIGDYFEFGVCHGSSIRLIYTELCRAGLDHVRLFGFDSFEGLPADDEGEWAAGSYSADYDTVRKSLDEYGVSWDRVSLIKGFYSDTLTDGLIVEHNMQKASLIMVDCDMYSSSIEALNFCLPLIQDDAVIIFDDWNPLAKKNKGEKRAFDEFLSKNPDITAVESGNYDYNPGDLHGKVFRVSRRHT